jgi:D-threo-aldose 1-dehydrogenase
MHSVRLAGTDLTTSALGFGCNALLGENTWADGLALLETAFDAGIRYFDVARVYGYGDAEKLVGKFVRNKRADLLIASKFGIEPLLTVSTNGYLRRVVRYLMRLSPALRNAIGRRARTAVRTGRFTPEAAQRSLETSLRTLATDYIDIYLLHDCAVEDASDELLDFLIRAKRDGKIRQFGVGTHPREAIAICTKRLPFAAVLQFENSILCPTLCRIRNPPAAVITHSALAASYSTFMAYLSTHVDVARRWSELIHADCSDPNVLSGLMLAHAVVKNGRGPVLFHSRRRQHIRANTTAIQPNSFSKEQVTEFGRLAVQLGRSMERNNYPKSLQNV